MSDIKVGDYVEVVSTNNIESLDGYFYQKGMKGCVKSVYEQGVDVYFEYTGDVPEGAKEILKEGRSIRVGKEDITLVKPSKWWDTPEGIEWLSKQEEVHEAFLKDQEASVTYSIGDRFRIFNGSQDEGEYILAQVFPYEVCLIGLETGNRWADPIKVEEIKAITKKEMNEIADTKVYQKIEVSDE